MILMKLIDIVGPYIFFNIKFDNRDSFENPAFFYGSWFVVSKYSL